LADNRVVLTQILVIMIDNLQQLFLEIHQAGVAEYCA
jgi:hypothetical protein